MEAKHNYLIATNSKLHKPKVLYDLYTTIQLNNDFIVAELPYIIHSLPISYEDGSTFGSLFIYQLPENDCILMKLDLGIPIKQQFLPYYVKNQKLVKIRQELQPQTNQQDNIHFQQQEQEYQELQEEIEDHFSWDLYAIKHDELSKIENNQFYALIQVMNRNYAGINQRKQIKVNEYQENLTIQFEFVQKDQKEKDLIDIEFMQLDMLMLKYSQYIAITMFNWRFLQDKVWSQDIKAENERQYYNALCEQLYKESQYIKNQDEDSEYSQNQSQSDSTISLSDTNDDNVVVPIINDINNNTVSDIISQQNDNLPPISPHHSQHSQHKQHQSNFSQQSVTQKIKQYIQQRFQYNLNNFPTVNEFYVNFDPSTSTINNQHLKKKIQVQLTSDDFLLRKNLIYPGKFITLSDSPFTSTIINTTTDTTTTNTTATNTQQPPNSTHYSTHQNDITSTYTAQSSPQMTCQLGTYLINQNIPIRTNQIEIDCKQIITLNTGEHYEIQVAKCLKLHQNCKEVKFQNFHFKIFIFAFFASNQQFSIKSQTSTLHRIKQQNMRYKLNYQFEFISKNRLGKWVWQSQIPLISTFYGGYSVSVTIGRQCSIEGTGGSTTSINGSSNDVLGCQLVSNGVSRGKGDKGNKSNKCDRYNGNDGSTQRDQQQNKQINVKSQYLLFNLKANKIVRPQSSFPLHASPLISFVQVQFQWATKQLFYPSNYIKDIDNIKFQKDNFLITNQSFQTYKCKERLPNTYQTLQVISYQMMQFVYMNLYFNTLTGYYFNNYNIKLTGGKLQVTKIQQHGLEQFEDQFLKLKLNYIPLKQQEIKFQDIPYQIQQKKFTVGGKVFMDQDLTELNNKFYQNCFKVDIYYKSYLKDTTINFFNLVTNFLLMEADTIWRDENDRFKRQMKYILNEVDAECSRKQLDKMLKLYGEEQIRQIYLDLGLQFSGVNVQLE